MRSMLMMLALWIFSLAGCERPAAAPVSPVPPPTAGTLPPPAILFHPAPHEENGKITYHAFPQKIALSQPVEGRMVRFVAKLAKDEKVSWGLGKDEDGTDGWAIADPFFPLNDEYLVAAEVLGDNDVILQTIVYPSPIRIDRKDPHLFDERTAKVGDVVAGMTITRFDMNHFPNEPLSYFGIVEFAGSATIKATYQHFGEAHEFLGGAICFYVDPEYADRIPRSLGDDRVPFFCATNPDDFRKVVGPPGSTGAAALSIDGFTYDYRPTETWNRAKVTAIEARVDPNLFDETSIQEGNAVAGWTVTQIVRTGSTPANVVTIQFEGEATGTGTFSQENAETLCFEPDRSFALRIPRSLQTPGGMMLCAANSGEVMARLGKVHNKRGEITIRQYRYEKREAGDTYQQAEFADVRILDDPAGR
ncbi:hypothetical protein G3578_13635 [Brevibacillus sp. SYP-B805]|uniref:hypothetical protein n=1 Tax=Brevibacillus sp. SYP-B805 TaxID=1578199 RepID=UPI0013EB3176|nr:hypothetical protein [Brevibacillus sp. SYP-B805]NGQ96203.1 hypothetical protein [Brevibacillus sp. SYP-B805]